MKRGHGPKMPHGVLYFIIRADKILTGSVAMYAQQPKKMLVMNILDILRKYTDEDHRLSQKDIIEILKTEYGMTADRKAVRRNLTNLMEAGYEIE